MDLYILRHAIAVERGTPGYASDADRPLTAEGERKLRKVVRAMERLKLSFDLVLSSPYVRARRTAEIVAGALGCRQKLKLSEHLAANDSRQFIQLLRTKRPLPRSVLIVGHEPYLSRLISLLASGEPRSHVTLKKAGLCKLTIASLRHDRCAMIEWLLTPHQMQLMG